MKNSILILLLSLAVVVGFTACGNKDSTPKTTENPTNTSEERQSDKQEGEDGKDAEMSQEGMNERGDAPAGEEKKDEAKQETAAPAEEGEEPMEEAAVTKVDSDKAKALIKDEGAVLIDVRSQQEHDERHIEGSVLIPMDEIGAKIEEQVAEKDKPIIVYCRSGRRSAIAAEELIKMGYTKVYDLGSIDAWKE